MQAGKRQFAQHGLMLRNMKRAAALESRGHEALHLLQLNKEEQLQLHDARHAMLQLYQQQRRHTDTPKVGYLVV
jgi:hypothetical protein